MDIYTATAEFHLPVEGVLVTVGTTIEKFSSKVATLIGSTEYDNDALYKWIGSDNSLLYLSFVSTVPDPVSSVVKAGSAAIASGNNVVVVSDSFGFTPTSVLVTVIKPSDADDNIFATVRNDSISSSGFTVDLSASTSVSGYVLAYIVSE